MPGQTEPDLHPNTVLIADLLCWDSLILLDIGWPSLWYGKHRQAVHTPGSPQGTLRVGETEVEGCLGIKVCSGQSEGILMGVGHVQPEDQR